MVTKQKEILLGWISKPHSKKEINDLALQLQIDENSLLFMLKIIKKVGKDQAMRISWLLRIWAEQNKHLTLIHLEKIMKLLEGSNNDSVLRNLLGIFIDAGIPTQLEGRITHLCCKMLGDKHRAVAVHVNSLTLLLPISKKYPLISHEINLLIKDHPNSLKPSFQVRIKRFQ